MFFNAYTFLGTSCHLCQTHIRLLQNQNLITAGLIECHFAAHELKLDLDFLSSIVLLFHNKQQSVTQSLGQ